MNDCTCKHYTGIQNTHCKAGVAYRDVTTDPDQPGGAYRKPCIDWSRHPSSLTEKQAQEFARRGKCDKREVPTKEELAAEDAEIEKLYLSVETARAAIIAHGKLRGSLPCPVCKTGELRYTKAASNGHVHASCTTAKCVTWVE